MGVEGAPVGILRRWNRTAEMKMLDANFKSQISSVQCDMARARRQIHADIGGAINGVQTLTDWKTIIRGHPWLSIGMAMAIGYLIVPRRRVKSEAEPGKNHPQREDRVAAPDSAATRISGSGKSAMLSSALAFISPIAVRLAQSYALRYFDNWLHDSGFPRAVDEPARPSHDSGAWTFSAATSPEGSREVPMSG
jgi:hypothetical protein